jgi:hypothetical protein
MTTIDMERASKDLDYAAKVAGISSDVVGKTLVAPTGEFKITEAVVHLNKFSVSKDGKEYNFPLNAIVANIIAGKMSIK